MDTMSYFIVTIASSFFKERTVLRKVEEKKSNTDWNEKTLCGIDGNFDQEIAPTISEINKYILVYNTFILRSKGVFGI